MLPQQFMTSIIPDYNNSSFTFLSSLSTLYSIFSQFSKPFLIYTFQLTIVILVLLLSYWPIFPSWKLPFPILDLSKRQMPNSSKNHFPSMKSCTFPNENAPHVILSDLLVPNIVHFLANVLQNSITIVDGWIMMLVNWTIDGFTCF